MEVENNNHGGFRPGSGRESFGERKVLSVRIHEDKYKIFVNKAKESGLSQSKYFEQLVKTL